MLRVVPHALRLDRRTDGWSLFFSRFLLRPDEGQTVVVCAIPTAGRVRSNGGSCSSRLRFFISCEKRTALRIIKMDVYNNISKNLAIPFAM